VAPEGNLGVTTSEEPSKHANIRSMTARLARQLYESTTDDKVKLAVLKVLAMVAGPPPVRTKRPKSKTKMSAGDQFGTVKKDPNVS
jgi:hypothetical protein